MWTAGEIKIFWQGLIDNNGIFELFFGFWREHKLTGTRTGRDGDEKSKEDDLMIWRGERIRACWCMKLFLYLYVNRHPYSYICRIIIAHNLPACMAKIWKRHRIRVPRFQGRGPVGDRNDDDKILASGQTLGNDQWIMIPLTQRQKNIVACSGYRALLRRPFLMARVHVGVSVICSSVIWNETPRSIQSLAERQNIQHRIFLWLTIYLLLVALVYLFVFVICSLSRAVPVRFSTNLF